MITGPAVVCDQCPTLVVGKQLGISLSGATIGSDVLLRFTLNTEYFSLLLGSPIGGLLYARFGFRGPFIFGIIVSLPDLVFRLLVIGERGACRPGLSSSDRIPLKVKELSNETVQSETKVSFARGFRLLLRSHRTLGAACVTAMISSVTLSLIFCSVYKS